MIPLYTQEEFNLAKSNTLLKCKCYICHQPFEKQKRSILKLLNNTFGNSGKFCSKQCYGLSTKKNKEVNCSNCEIIFKKKESQIKKTLNNFCSQSCAASYQQRHKSHGTRRSKLEVYLEEQLLLLFPTLEIHYNRKDTINSELDIYIPSLKLAFELNGIFHYEPIYGSDKLSQIQNNDNRKFQACLEQGIELCIIDASGLKYFKPTNAQKYLNIIVNLLVTISGVQ